MRSHFTKLTLGLFVVAVLALCALTSPRTAAVLRPHLEEAASAAMHAQVTVGTLRITALPLGVVLGDIEMMPDPDDGASEGPPWTARLKHLRLRPALLRSAWWGRPALGLVQARGLWLSATVPPQSAKQPEGPHRDLWPIRKPWPIDVVEADCSDIDLHLRAGPRALEALGLSVHLGPYGHGQRAWTVDSPHGTLTDPSFLPPGKQPMSVRLDGTLDGRMHRPQTLSIARGSVDLPGWHAALDGALDLTGDRPKHAITVDLSTTLAALTAATPSWAALNLGGTVRAQAVVHRPLGDVDAALSITVDHLKGPGRPALSQVRLRGQVGPRGLWLEQAALMVDQQDCLYAEGHLGFGQDLPFELTLQLHAAPLEALLGWATGKPSQLSAPLGGMMLGRGHLGGTWAVHTTWDVTATPLTLMSPHAPPLAILKMPSLALRGQFDSTQARTVAHNIALRAGPSGLVADGEVLHRASYAKDAGYFGPVANLRIWAGGFDLRHLGPIAHMAYRGAAGVGGSLRGPLFRPHLQGHAHVDGFVIGPYPLGDADSTLRFDAPNLVLTQLAVREGEGLVQGTLTLNFGPLGLNLNTDLEASNVDAAGLARTLGLPQSLAQHIDGALFGPVHLSGPLLRPQGTVQLATPSLLMGQVPLGPAAANGR